MSTTRGTLLKSVLPALFSGALLGGGAIGYYQQLSKNELQENLTLEKKENKKLKQKNTVLYEENVVFHRHGFNKRLVERGIKIYSGLGEFVPFTNERLNENIMNDFVKGMNRKEDLLRRLYSSEYHNYKARQILPGQSFEYKDNRKNDLYTLDISYENETKDIREDILALIAEGNFKSLVQEHYTNITFHELFALVRTILSNIRQPLNTYTLEEREIIISTIISNRVKSAEKEIIGSEHTMINLIGKDPMFASVQTFVDLYKSITSQENRDIYQFRDNDFTSYWDDTNTIYSSIGNRLEQAGKNQRPYTFILANHGGIQDDEKTGRTVIVDGKLYIDPYGLSKLLTSTHNTAKGVSNIQYLHCNANNSALPLVQLLEKSSLKDSNLPIIILQSEMNETAFASSNNTTPYNNYLEVGNNKPLQLKKYYFAQAQPLGYNASIYVPYTMGVVSEVRESHKDIRKHDKYIQQY